MKIILFEPYFSGSHAQWARELKESSQHQIELFTLPGVHWKWRMHGSAISLFNTFRDSEHYEDADLLLATSMCDLSTVRALLHRDRKSLACALYFHENQLGYPFSPDDPDPDEKRDRHYGFIQIASALAADHCFFNTEVHRDQFISAVRDYLEVLPDHRLPEAPEKIRANSSCLHIGIHLKKLIEGDRLPRSQKPVILWNHRHDYDKDPESFFNALFACAEEGHDFSLIVTGQENGSSSPIFEEAQKKLADRIVHWGYCESRDHYHELLLQSDILPVSSKQDFFGISVVEAMAAGAYPLLPDGLVYREHESRNTYYYQANALAEKLKEVLQGENWRSGYDARSGLMRYDWSEMARKSDVAFEQIVERARAI